MRLIYICIGCFCLLTLKLEAKDFNLYEWEENRARYELSGQDKSLSEIIIRQHTQYDYVLENSQYVMYSTIHRIIYVNNNEAVQKHNDLDQDLLKISEILAI